MMDADQTRDDEYANFLQTRPTRVVWLSAPTGASSYSMHTFCFVGNEGVPKQVREELARISGIAKMRGRDAARDAMAHAKILRAYFETDNVADVLGYNLTRDQIMEAQGPVPRDESRAVRMGGDSADDEELEALERALEEENVAQTPIITTVAQKLARVDRGPQFADGEVTFVLDNQMFPEDSVMDVKRKIFVTTHIPIYRQHVVAIYLRAGRSSRADSNAQRSDIEPASMGLSYNISTAGSHVVDFRDLYNGSSNIMLFDIPIDRAIYDAREDLRVEARDHITTINRTRPDVYVVIDIANWIASNIEQVRTALNDNYQFELLYYGFAVKYFPQLTRECFHAYIANEHELADRFPDLAPSWVAIQHAIQMQNRISAGVYFRARKPRTDVTHIILRAAVTTRKPGSVPSPINIRDMFDSLVCSKTILDVRAIVDNTPFQREKRDAYRYELRKIYKFSELMSTSFATSGRIVDIRGENGSWVGRIPTLGNEPGLLLTFMFDSIPMFLIARPTGRVSFQFQWREEDNIGFDEMASMFKKHTTALVREMRESGVYAASHIEPVLENNMRVQSLAVAVLWQRTITSRAFRVMREMWNDYIRAGIIIPRQTSKDALSFVFSRGIMEIDAHQLEQRLIAANIAETNHYAYLSVSAIRQKWMQNFAGRVVNVVHRATDVRFDVMDIYEREYTTFELYLAAFISNFAHERSDVLETQLITNGTPEHRRLRRLQEIDPVLYNLKKHGAPRVYSTRCQHGKQPVVYSEQEERTKGAIPKSAVKYWNFTLNKPAYYSCPDAKYPHLNFITNVHPRGYCIPCCGKKRPTPGSKHAKIEKICMENHMFDVNKLIEQPINYVMSYGKNLPEGRLSQLPAGYLRDTLNRAISSLHPGASLLIYGVPQDISVVHTIRAILDMTLEAFISGLVRGINSGMAKFDAIAGGRAATYFASKQALAGYIAEIATGRERFVEGTADFARAIITDCVRAVYDLDMIYLAAAEQVRDMRIIMAHSSAVRSDGEDKEGLAFIGQDGSINPIFAIHPDDFARNNSIAARALPNNCRAIFRQIAHGNKGAIKTIDLEFITAFALEGAYSIAKYYVGLRGLCYAVLLRTGNSTDREQCAYIPITYCSLATSRAGQVAFDSLDDDASPRANLAAIEAINAHIIRGRLPYHKLVIESTATITSSKKIIGFIVQSGTSKMLSYFTDDQNQKKDAEQQWAKLPQTALAIDPRSHARMLLASNIAPGANPVVAQITEAAARAMYPYYEYELFCVQFMAQTSTFRNEVVRAKITAILTSGQSAANKRDALAALGLSRKDMATITNYIYSRKKTGSVSLRHIALEVDLADFYAHIGESRADLARWIKTIMAPVVKRVCSTSSCEDQTVIRVPTIIMPCKKDEYTKAFRPHCTADGAQLYLVTDIGVLSDILAADLQNPLKRAYIMARGATPESRSSFTDFAQRENEVLLVRKSEIIA